jgi:hypothetical protein
LTRGTSLNAAAQTELTHKRRSNERKQPKPLEKLRFAPQNLIPGADKTQPVNAVERSQTELNGRQFIFFMERRMEVIFK